MKVLTPSAMREADRLTIAGGTPGLLLMENAAYGLLRAIEQRFSPLAAHRIAIVCGKGNNGGDGLALARLLHIHHNPPHLTVLLAFPPEDLSEDAAAQLRLLEQLGIPYTMQWPQDFPATTLVVDALLGTGASGAVREPIASAIARIRALPLAKVVAVDLPSAGQLDAHLTVTFAALKTDHALPPSCHRMGEIVVAPIGIPEQHLHTRLHLTSKSDLAVLALPRPRDAHKGTFGHVALIGGADGKPGALQLAGAAALSAGAGLVTLISPDPSFRPHLPDLMLGVWPPAAAPYRVLAIGPGLGTGEDVRPVVRTLFDTCPVPLVLDADALNLLAPLTRPASSVALRVLTPHPGEMRRLLGRDIEDRLADASALAQLTRCVVVLKGERSIIAFPTGESWINPTGSPALAKAGSGDVLTGLLTACLSQYPDHHSAAILAAVYLHGRCGELAHERSSLASRLCDHLPEAFDELR